jgi:hypothetical protein
MSCSKFMYEESVCWSIGDLVNVVGSNNKLSRYLVISSKDSRQQFKTKGYESTAYSLFRIEDNTLCSHTIINRMFDVK